MSMDELQQEELEVLQSIYEGDEAFKQISETVFQYKFGENDTSKSFIVEISWPKEYPEVLPDVNLEVFYNKHLLPAVKDHVKSELTQQANDLMGMSMTFSLFEWVKDNLEEILTQQPDAPVQQVVSSPVPEITENSNKKEVKEKKEHLSKNQKRRMYDKFGSTADRPRGWDWVDIIKHLSQTGGQKSES